MEAVGGSHQDKLKVSIELNSFPEALREDPFPYGVRMKFPFFLLLLAEVQSRLLEATHIPWLLTQVKFFSYFESL